MQAASVGLKIVSRDHTSGTRFGVFHTASQRTSPLTVRDEDAPDDPPVLDEAVVMVLIPLVAVDDPLEVDAAPPVVWDPVVDAPLLGPVDAVDRLDLDTPDCVVVVVPDVPDAAEVAPVEDAEEAGREPSDLKEA